MRTLSILALLLVGPALQAQDDKSWQLDLIAFERSNAGAYDSFDDTWRFRRIDWPPMLPLDAEFPLAGSIEAPPPHVSQRAAEKGVRILSWSRSGLGEAAERLRGSARYRVLARHSLRFAQKTRTPRLRLQGGEPLRLIARDTRQDLGSGMDYWLSAPDLEPPVYVQTFDGWARLDHQIHPILELDLVFLELLPGVFPLQTDPDGRQEYFRDQVQQYRLSQERRLRPGLTAYFDHPRIGVLARLTEVVPPATDDDAAAEGTAAR